MFKPSLMIAIVALISSSAFAQSEPSGSINNLKFLDDITVQSAAIPASVKSTSRNSIKEEPVINLKKTLGLSRITNSIERATGLQFKYAMLLDIEVELVQNLDLFRMIDDWYGVRYRYGGESKSGIDCSALMQIFFTALYGVALPRTAREQYSFSRRISRAELKEGDLVFFNTTGGVSHVGMYLANNKFVHASSSGVMISDLYDDYYSRRFIGVGRVDEMEPAMALTSPRP